ncbi:MAG: hypothetical protein PHQ43_15650, partial [Dehalococcoidales bacterium]|nr:hypothetical protein [Dehalococcoidales bacterium]
MEGANYTQQVLYGTFSAMGEMATEAIPFEHAMKVINKLGVDNLVEQGSKNLLKHYGGVGIDYLKAMATETVQEAIMSPWNNLVKKSVYQPGMPVYGEKGVIDPDDLIQSGYGGLAMSVVLGALGLPVTSASYLRARQAITKQEKDYNKVLGELSAYLRTDLTTLDNLFALEGKDVTIGGAEGPHRILGLDDAGQIIFQNSKGEQVKVSFGEIKQIDGNNIALTGKKVAPESPVTRTEEPSKVIGRPEAEKPPEAKPGAIETKPAKEPWAMTREEYLSGDVRATRRKAVLQRAEKAAEPIRQGLEAIDFIKPGETIEQALIRKAQQRSEFYKDPLRRGGKKRGTGLQEMSSKNWSEPFRNKEAAEEFRKAAVDYIRGHGKGWIEKSDWTVDGKLLKKVFDSPRILTQIKHEQAVKQALSEGKPVPPEVLKDYPDLAKAKPAAPEAKPAAIKEGQTVYNQKGEPLTVVDVSDPSLLTVRNARGTEFKTGRKTVTTEKPAAPETKPKAEVFSRTDTGMPGYNEMLEKPDYQREWRGREFAVVDMSPKDYLERVTEMHGTTLQRTRETAHGPTQDWLKQQFDEGKPIPMAVLDYKAETQEGRARAVFAEKQGLKTIPVMVVWETGKPPAIPGLTRAEKPAKPAETVPTEEKTAEIEAFVQNRWDSAKLGKKVEYVKRSGWTTKDGRLTKLGEKIAQSKWEDLSPAAQNVIRRRVAEDYPHRVPIEPVETAPKAEAITERDLHKLTWDAIEQPYKETRGVGKYKGLAWRTKNYRALDEQGVEHEYTVRIRNDGKVEVTKGRKTRE